MAKRAWIIIGGLTLAFMITRPLTAVAQQDVTGPTVLQYSNVRYSPSRKGLVGANIRLVREDGTLNGRFTLFQGNAGRTYNLRGTMSNGRIRFSVRAGDQRFRFKGQIEDGSLVGTLTRTTRDGSKETSDFRARRMYR